MKCDGTRAETRFQLKRLKLLFQVKEIALRMMLMFRMVLISLTQNGISDVYFGNDFKRNTVFIGAVVTLALLPAQQLQGQQVYTISLRQSKTNTWNGTRLVSYRLLKIFIYERT